MIPFLRNEWIFTIVTIVSSFALMILVFGNNGRAVTIFGIAIAGLILGGEALIFATKPKARF